MTIEIRKARTDSEASAAFRLRYEVYIEELGRSQRCADPVARLIHEPLDRHANLLCAYNGPRLVGTVRTNYTHCSPLAEYEQLYEMARVGAAHPGSTSVTTKLVVAREYRGTALAYRLAAATYAIALRDGILYDFVDVYPARVPFFERLGYCVHVPRAVHAEYGEVIVMRLGMRDESHLRQVGSPFLRYLLKETRAAA